MIDAGQVVRPISIPPRSASNSERRVWLGSGVSGASQVQYVSNHRLRCSVDRSASAMAVCQVDRAFLPVRRQHAPGVARTHSKQLGL